LDNIGTLAGDSFNSNQSIN